MSKAGRIMVYLFSLSVIIVFLTMFQSQVGAQEVISLDPVTFYGQLLPDTALANLTGTGDWVVIQLNESPNGGNNQVNNVNNSIVLTGPGYKVTNLDPKTTKALRTFISLYKK